MAEEGARTVSSRGSFVIGLVLGVGLGCLFGFFQHQRFTMERAKLKVNNEILQKSLLEARGVLASEKEASSKK
jgi:hypothetical protein